MRDARLIIACTRPGLIRGGIRHPRLASYPLDLFAEPALREMLAEPELAVVLGAEVTPDMLPFVAAQAAAHQDAPPQKATDGAEGAADTAPSDGAPSADGAAKNPARSRAGRKAH